MITSTFFFFFFFLIKFIYCCRWAVEGSGIKEIYDEASAYLKEATYST